MHDPMEGRRVSSLNDYLPADGHPSHKQDPAWCSYCYSQIGGNYWRPLGADSGH